MLGDISHALRTMIKNRSDIDGALSTADERYADRVIASTRSLIRGGNFTPYINISDEQNDADIAVVAIAPSAFADDIRAPSGRKIAASSAGVANLATITLSSSLASEYYGTFHVFLRGDITSGVATDFGLSLQITDIQGTEIFYETEYIQFDHISAFAFIDFGAITLPAKASQLIQSEQVEYIRMAIRADAAVAGLDLFDLILMPVDEFAADLVNIRIESYETSMSGPLTDNYIGSDIGEPKLLDIDAVSVPKTHLSAKLRTSNTDYATYQYIASSPLALQANSNQRVWFLCFRNNRSNGYWTSEPWNGNSLQITGNARYLYARGAR